MFCAKQLALWGPIPLTGTCALAPEYSTSAPPSTEQKMFTPLSPPVAVAVIEALAFAAGILIADDAESMPLIDYTAGYHRSQWLATILALAERKRPVAAIVLKDLSNATLTALDEFMRQASKHVTL